MKKRSFLHKRSEGAVGFVYKAYMPDGSFYIGQKRYDSIKKLKPLKGKTRKRISIKDSGWEYYKSSNAFVQEQAIRFELVQEAYSKSELNALEAYYILNAWFNKKSIVNTWVEKKIMLKHIKA